jgi:hypothetical protein
MRLGKREEGVRRLLFDREYEMKRISAGFRIAGASGLLRNIAYHRASSIAREMLGSPRVYGVQWSEAVFYIVVDEQEIATMAFSESAKHLR